MNDLLTLPDEELIDTAALTDEEFYILENRLAVFAACRGWTGDPLRQPLAIVAQIVRGILEDRNA